MSRLASTNLVPVVSAERAIEERLAIVDLRSPAEFAEDHLPGARNVPLFDDAERALVGTLYRRESPAAAFEKGREVTLAKIQALVEEIAEIGGWALPEVDLGNRVEELTARGIEALDAACAPERRRGAGVERPLAADTVALYCWRGGLRSRSVAGFLRGLGCDHVVALEGGYKGYRRGVLKAVEAWRAPRTVVLRGLTGVGKTLVLRALEELRPGWTLDLEALAGHRSSVLGMVGLEPCSQKLFESRLATRLRRGFQGPCVVEGESRKVGDVVLPPSVWEPLRAGICVELVASLDRRIDVLVEDYLEHEENRAGIAEKLPFLEERMGSKKWGGVLTSWLREGREREVVEALLREYYDPLYRHSETEYHYAVRIEADDPQRAASEFARWIEASGAD